MFPDSLNFATRPELGLEMLPVIFQRILSSPFLYLIEVSTGVRCSAIREICIGFRIERKNYGTDVAGTYERLPN